jgi:hypothetical protein
VVLRLGNAVPATENVERNAPAPLRQRIQAQSEEREPIPRDDDEWQLSRLQQFLSERRTERRRIARLWWWGILAAVALVILVVAAVRFGPGLGLGRNSLSGALQPLAPPSSEAPPSVGLQPPPVAASHSAIEQVPAPLPSQPPPPTHVEPTPSSAVASSSLPGSATLSRRSGAAVDSVQIMADSLIAKLGHERAEEAARRNASWYAPGSERFLYWQNVAKAVRTVNVPPFSEGRAEELIPSAPSADIRRAWPPQRDEPD